MTTSERNDLKDSFKKLLFYFIVGLPVGICTSLLRAHVITVVWAWFLQKTVGTPLTIGAAFGLTVLFGLLRGVTASDRVAVRDPALKDIGIYRSTFESALYSILVSLFGLLGAFTFKLFIG